MPKMVRDRKTGRLRRVDPKRSRLAKRAARKNAAARRRAAMSPAAKAKRRRALLKTLRTGRTKWGRRVVKRKFKPGAKKTNNSKPKTNSGSKKSAATAPGSRFKLAIKKLAAPKSKTVKSVKPAAKPAAKPATPATTKPTNTTVPSTTTTKTKVGTVKTAVPKAGKAGGVGVKGGGKPSKFKLTIKPGKAPVQTTQAPKAEPKTSAPGGAAKSVGAKPSVPTVPTVPTAPSTTTNKTPQVPIKKSGSAKTAEQVGVKTATPSASPTTKPEKQRGNSGSIKTGFKLELKKSKPKTVNSPKAVQTIQPKAGEQTTPNGAPSTKAPSTSPTTPSAPSKSNRFDPWNHPMIKII